MIYYPEDNPMVEEEEFSLYVNQSLYHVFHCTPEALGELAAGHILIKERLPFASSITIDLIDFDRFEIHASLIRDDSPQYGSCPDFVLPDVPQLRSIMSGMFSMAEKYRSHRGIHCSALSDGKSVLAFFEDVGRHNAFDKVVGDAYFKGLDLRKMMYFTSGRVTSEIIGKTAACRLPCIISRSITTTRALRIAEENSITIVGRIETEMPIIYSQGVCCG